ncbi:MAG: hypothetical protein HN764_08105 [Gammaproteobacteria bacterium]|jgi:hypothetical protein|nr:hypothetical protein [Gammaproteobacteria bacterium]
MKVRSKLADVDFQIGAFEYKKDHLIVNSAESQAMKTKVYVSPDDIVRALGQILRKPMVWLYLLAFPFFLIRYRKRHAEKQENN